MVRFTKEAHADLRRLYDFLVDKDPRALFDQIGAEMWAVVRPGVDWKKH